MRNTHIFYNIKDLDLMQTFECGQCFRWNREDDGSYTGIALGYPANMKLVEGMLVIEGYGDREFWEDYMDLESDYEDMQKAICEGECEILPEAVKAAGAVGVMLNHAEKPLTMEAVEKTIKRADEVGLATIVCADTVEDVKTIAKMSPNLIVAEPTELIGTGQTSDSNYVLDTINTVREINPDIMVLQGAGISNGQDVYNTIKLGAQATGSTSGILKAVDPYAMVEEMLYNLRKAWDELHK